MGRGSMSRPVPVEKRAEQFVKAHLGRSAFAAFSGQDVRAWRAFCHLLDCWAAGAGDDAIDAMAGTVLCAQADRGVLQAFVQTIPAILDWHHVAEVWPKIVAAAQDRTAPRLPAAAAFWTAQERDTTAPNGPPLRLWGLKEDSRG